MYAHRISKHKKSKSNTEIRKDISMNEYYSKNSVLLYVGKKIVEERANTMDCIWDGTEYALVI